MTLRIRSLTSHSTVMRLGLLAVCFLGCATTTRSAPVVTITAEAVTAELDHRASELERLRAVVAELDASPPRTEAQLQSWRSRARESDLDTGARSFVDVGLGYVDVVAWAKRRTDLHASDEAVAVLASRADEGRTVVLGLAAVRERVRLAKVVPEVAPPKPPTPKFSLEGSLLEHLRAAYANCEGAEIAGDASTVTVSMPKPCARALGEARGTLVFRVADDAWTIDARSYRLGHHRFEGRLLTASRVGGALVGRSWRLEAEGTLRSIGEAKANVTTGAQCTTQGEGATRLEVCRVPTAPALPLPTEVRVPDGAPQHAAYDPIGDAILGAVRSMATLVTALPALLGAFARALPNLAQSMVTEAVVGGSPELVGFMSLGDAPP